VDGDENDEVFSIVYNRLKLNSSKDDSGRDSYFI
jgi:hypothetical protein